MAPAPPKAIRDIEECYISTVSRTEDIKEVFAGQAEKYGGRIVFWGGGVDTQKTLPFGSPDQVRREVTENLRIFNQKNGFVFATIHNIQCNTPTENLLAMFEALGRQVNFSQQL